MKNQNEKNLLKQLNKFSKGKGWFLSYNLIDSSKNFINRHFIALFKEKPLTQKHCKKLITSFFSKKKTFYPNSLIEYFHTHCPEHFLKTIKRQKHFFEPSLLTILKQLKGFNKNNIIEEFESLSPHRNKHEKLRQELIKTLATIPLDELLFDLSIWLDKHYIKSSIDEGLVLNINPILEKGASIIIVSKQSSKDCNSLDLDSLQVYKDKIGIYSSIYPSEFDKMGIDDKNALLFSAKFYYRIETYAKTPSLFSDFDSIMDIAQKIAHWEVLEDEYCYREGQVFVNHKGLVSILPNNVEDEINWRKISALHLPLQLYYYRKGATRTNNFQNNSFYESTNPAVPFHWEMNGFPKEIPLENYTFKPYELLLFLNGLSLFHKQRYYEKLDQTIAKSPIVNPFQIIYDTIRGRNLWIKPIMGSINCTTKEFLVERVKSYISFDKSMKNEELVSMLDFILYDLKSDNNRKYGFLETPFIKIGNLFFYNTLSVYFNNPSIIIENLMFRGKNNTSKKLLDIRLEEYETEDNSKKNTIKDIVSIALEKKIAESLEQHLFFSKHSVELEKGDKGEIDVLAWKGNQLLVIQAKKTYTRREIKNIAPYTDTLIKAGEQTDNCIKYILEHKEIFLEENKIHIDPDKLEVYGLIVSSTQEGNFKLYGEGKYPKISLAELQIILNDEKEVLIDEKQKAFEIHYQSISKGRREYDLALSQEDINQINGIYYLHRDAIKQYLLEISLWKKQFRNISTLLDAIKRDWLWEDIIFLDDISFPNKDATANERKAFLLYGEAKAAYDKREYKTSIKLAKEAFELMPSDPDYLVIYADTLAEIGKKKEALEKYNLLLDQSPEYEIGYMNRGKTLMELNCFSEALNDFEKVLTISPNNEEGIYYSLYIQLENKLSKGQSVDEFLPLLNTLKNTEYILNLSVMIVGSSMQKKGTNSNFAKIQFANLYSACGEFDEAHEIYDRILQKSPTNLEAILGKGTLYLQQEKQKKAIKYFKRIQGKLKDKVQKAYYLAQLGVANYHLNKHECAKKYYEQALNTDSYCYSASYNLGIYYFNKEDEANWAKAIQYFEHASQSIECGHLAHENLVHIFKDLGHYKKALYHLDELIKIGHFDLVKFYSILLDLDKR